MSMMWNLVRKDIRGLRVVVWLWLAALAVVTAAGALVPALVGYKGLDMTARTLLMLKPFLQYLMVALIVPLLIHQDPLVEARAFWLTRPISRRTLLAAKAMFLALVVVLPVLVGELITLACNGLGPRYLLFATPEILLEIVSGVCLIGVLAVLTRNFGQYAVALVAFIFAYGVSSFGINAVITHLLPELQRQDEGLTTGVLQTQAFAGWLATIAIGGFVVAWQFLTRRSRPAMIVGVLGMLYVIILRGILLYDCFGGSGINGEANPMDCSLTLKEVRLSETAGAWSGAWFLDATMELNGTTKSLRGEVSSGELCFNYPGAGEFKADVVGGAMFWGVEYPEKNHSLVHEIPFQLKVKTEGAEPDWVLGRTGTVTGTVGVYLFPCRVGGVAYPREGNLIVTGLDRARVISVESRAGDTRIAIRKTFAMIAIGGEKSAQIVERTAPQAGDIFELEVHSGTNTFPIASTHRWLHEAPSIELKSAEAAFMWTKFRALASPLRLLTSVLRLGLPPRLVYMDMELVFPNPPKRIYGDPEEWLKSAELIYHQTMIPISPAGLEASFKAANVVIQPSRKSAETLSVRGVVEEPTLEGSRH